MSDGHGNEDRHCEQGRANSPVQGFGKDPLTLPHPRAEPRAPSRRLDHTYRDYSNFPLGEVPTGKKAPTNFPRKLHHILSTHEYSHIISWMPHGRAWRIHNKELLIREVVPKYFSQSKYVSFTRQLNGWGFKRLYQSGNDFNAYYHECFLRGIPRLVVLMKRVPPNQGKLLPHVEGEPNFYELDKQFPLPPPPMPSQGHFQYSPFHVAASTGYGPPPEAPTGYHSPSNQLSHPSNYPPPPPYYAGHHGDYHAAPAYAPQAGYPSYPYYHTSYQPPPEQYPHYPYPPGPLYGTQSQYNNHPPNDNTGPVKSRGIHLAPVFQGAVQEERPGSPNGTQSHYDNPLPNYNTGHVKRGGAPSALVPQEATQGGRPTPLHSTQSCDGNPPNNNSGHAEGKEDYVAPFPFLQAAIQEERIPIKDKGRENSLKQYFVSETENTTAD